MGRTTRLLEDAPVPIRLKLSALWAATMFCYIYGDYFGLYVPGKLAAVGAGHIGFGPATPAALVAVSALMAIPGLMVALSLLLPATASRWANVFFGLAYSAVMLLTMYPGEMPYYLFLGVIEVALTLSIAWLALRWRRASAAD